MPTGEIVSARRSWAQDRRGSRFSSFGNFVKQIPIGMPRALRYLGNWLGDSADTLKMIHANENVLRWLIPSVAAAEAAIWRARAESGVMHIDATRIHHPNRDVLWGEVHKWESLAAKEPSRGNAAHAIATLRMLGCRRYAQCAPTVLHALASGKVTWQSDTQCQHRLHSRETLHGRHSLHKICTLAQLYSRCSRHSLRSLSTYLRRPRKLARSSLPWWMGGVMYPRLRLSLRRRPSQHRTCRRHRAGQSLI